ncbi:hypothetical protein DXG01_005735 [Tephrocybe rancida]|nr:hypothetical protein DXG01_005735 [Tephrocybe rancida]
MGNRSNVAKARLANLNKNRVPKPPTASALTAPPEDVEDVEFAQPPKKKQRTQSTLSSSLHRVASRQSQPPTPASTAQTKVLEKTVYSDKNAATQGNTKVPTAKVPTTRPTVAAVATVQDAKIATAIASSVPDNANEPSSGPYCLYSTQLPFLQAALVPNAKTGKKDYASLFAKIKECQTKKDRTMQCFLSFPPTSGSVGGYGCIKSRCDGFTEPMGDEPYDVGIAGLRKFDSLVLPDGQGAYGPGFHGTLVLAEDDCGVSSVSEDFKLALMPVWKGMKGEVMWEGHVKFNVRYGMYSRKGHGRGTCVEFGFWAIGSVEGDKLEEGDVARFAGGGGVSGGVGAGYDDFDFDDDEDEDDYDDRYSGGHRHVDVSSQTYKKWFKNYRPLGIQYDEYLEYASVLDD